MAQIRFAGAGDVPGLKELWKIAFGDEDDYIDGFYRDRFRPEETLLLEEEGRVGAMLSLLPMETVLADGRRFSTPCVYAVATHPTFRGRGFATILMEDAHRRMEARGEAGAVIVPASPSLFDFYGQRGFLPAFSLRERELTPDQLLDLPRDPEISLSPVSPAQYRQRREEFLRGICHVDCGEEGFRYQEKICGRSRGDLLGIRRGPVEGCAVVERYGETIAVKELLLPAALTTAGLAALADAYTCRKLAVRTPLAAGEEGGSPRPFAMARWYDRGLAQAMEAEQPGYLGIAYD